MVAQRAHEQILIFFGIGQRLLYGLYGGGVGNNSLQFAARATSFKDVILEVFGG